MADPESFLQEVSDEVRRDRFYQVLKKYGWLLALLVFVAVVTSISFELIKSAEYDRAKKMVMHYRMHWKRLKLEIWTTSLHCYLQMVNI